MRSLTAGALLLAFGGCGFNAGAIGTAPQIRPGELVNDAAAPPEVASTHGIVTLELAAVINSTNGLPAFLYQGEYVAPTIRVNPGDTIQVDLDNELPPGHGAASDVNLHFHGLNVSPRRPADDVITMFAKSGRTIFYSVPIPATQPPGLYWYHPHIHGQTDNQVGRGGMSGAIVVEGIQRHIPALAKMPERILIVRELGNNGGEVRHHDGAPKGGMASMGLVESPDTAPGPSAGNVPCAPLASGDYITVNSELEPTIRFTPGKPQFFRILNATGHRHIDLTLGDVPMHVVGVDGYPVDGFPGQPSSFTQTHIVVPPAGRIEFFATVTAATELRSRCFDSGPIGDSDPPELLAHLRPYAGSQHAAAVALEPPRAAAPLAVGTVSHAIPPPAATRLVRFSEDAKGFYINGRAYSPNEAPVFVVKVGTVERWTVKNFTLEDHDFHLHQVHFHVEAVNGIADAQPLWRDTVVVPHGTRLAGGGFKPGSITLIADFRDPQIRGTFLFHCHILDHEDGGMMAKIRAI